MILRGRIPRMTPKEHHDLVVNDIGNNLEIIYNSKAFDNIKLFDRENNLLYNYRENSDISPKNILEKEFYCEWKIEEIKKFEEKWKTLIMMMENKPRAAPPRADTWMARTRRSSSGMISWAGSTSQIGRAHV